MMLPAAFLLAEQAHSVTLPDWAVFATFFAKAVVAVASGLGGLWVALEKIGKPFIQWRRESFGVDLRTALRPELEMLARLVSNEDSRANRVDRALNRQSQTFEEFDALNAVVEIHDERLDEINDLLDAAGFASERRLDGELRKKTTEMLHALAERRLQRRRDAEVEPSEDLAI